MRRIMSGVGLLVCGAVAACTVFSGDDSRSPRSSSDSTDAGTSQDSSTESGLPPVADDGIAIHVDAAEVRVVQGKSVQIPVTLVRGKDAQGPVVVTVSGLRSGLSAKPLTIEGTDGMLEVTATVDVAQGPANATLDGAFADKHVSLPLNLFVRGPSGSLDTTFANQGIYQESAAVSTMLDIAADPSGALMVFYSCPIGLCIHRLSAEGVLDPTYGDNGTGSIGINTRYTSNPSSDPVRAVQAVRASDGGWVIGSPGGKGLGSAGYIKGSIGRIKSDGMADSAFGAGSGGGTAGMIASPFEYGFRGLVLNDKDEIFATGTISRDPKTFVDTVATFHYSKSGEKDAVFNTVIPVLNPERSQAQPETVAGLGLSQNGSVLVLRLGSVGISATGISYYGLVAMLGNSGKIDASFGLDGRSRVDHDYANNVDSFEFDYNSYLMRGIVFGRDGRLTSVLTSTDPQNGQRSAYRLASFSKNGLPNTSFGKASGYTDPFPRDDYTSMSLALTSDGRAVVVSATPSDFLNRDNRPAKLVRHDLAGKIDKTFGVNGGIDIPANDGQPAVLVQSDGRIVVAMTKVFPNDARGEQLMVLRYWD